MSVRSILTTCATELLAHERPTVERIVQKAYEDYAEEFAEESEGMMLAHARTVAKQIISSWSDDDNGSGGSKQLELSGFELPTAIAVPNGEGFYYVRSDRAVWTEILAGESTRVFNVIAAQSKLDRYRDAVSQLRPFMEEHPDRTVADAIHLMHGDN